jgi:GAF domain-containing protein
VSADLKKDKHWMGLNAAYTMKNMLAVPLVLGKKTIGVIEVINRDTSSPFNKRDVAALTSLASHFSVIMERSGLFAQLDERIRQFSTLHEVGALLTSTLDQSVVRQRAMEAITRLMKAETGSLLLVDKEKNELFFEVALGDKGGILKEIRLKMGEGIAGWVAEHNEPVIIHDVSTDKRFQGKMDAKSKFTTRDMVCVPVEIKGAVIGVLQAINSLGGTFDDDDVKLFQLFSNQVAIALDNARLYEEIKETFYATSEALAEAIEKRDPYTGGHTKRVLWYSLAIAVHLGLDKDMIEMVKLSAVLHDVGKIGIEDRILRKQTPLDDSEFASMKQHPMLGADILKHVPQLKDVLPGMLYHHERIDGLGYPKRLKDGEIPIIAKIISVADTYDAMTTTRPYRKGLPTGVAIDEIKKWSGRQFDESVVEAFIKAFDAGEITNVPATAAPMHVPQ